MFIPDDVINYMIALRVNFFFIVPDINLLHGFVFFDSEAIVNSLLLYDITSSTILMTSSWMNSF